MQHRNKERGKETPSRGRRHGAEASSLSSRGGRNGRSQDITDVGRRQHSIVQLSRAGQGGDMKIRKRKVKTARSESLNEEIGNYLFTLSNYSSFTSRCSPAGPSSTALFSGAPPTSSQLFSFFPSSCRQPLGRTTSPCPTVSRLRLSPEAPGTRRRHVRLTKCRHGQAGVGACHQHPQSYQHR